MTLYFQPGGGMKLGEITEQVLSACFQVSNELGHGFLESVYEKSLLIALQGKGLAAESQVPLRVRFRQQTVGEFFADVVVEKKVILELKAVKALAPEHMAQVLNYLKATGMEVGLLINFGSPKLEYRRFENRFLEFDSQG
jgi:GxxExxY protein